jgi:hypothetical protein
MCENAWLRRDVRQIHQPLVVLLGGQAQAAKKGAHFTQHVRLV